MIAEHHLEELQSRLGRLGRAHVPDLGTLNVRCEVKPGGTVNTVSWGQ